MRSKNTIQQMEQQQQERRKEILNMSNREIEFNTKYIIHFEDFEQDFLEWHIDKNGYILDSKPFQRNIWAGMFTIPQSAEVGEKLAIWNGEESYVNYPIKSIIQKERSEK